LNAKGFFYYYQQRRYTQIPQTQQQDAYE